MRTPRATSMMEVMAGALVLIPILLLAVDGAYVLIASKSNQELAESAARIAANKTTKNDAVQAASNAVARFPKTDNMDAVKMEKVDYCLQKRMVTVCVVMDVRMPVPLPVMNSSTHLSA